MRTALACLLLLASTAYGQMRPGGGPPPEASAACASLAEGAACQFETPRGRITGQCRSLPQGSRACVPGGQMPSGERGTTNASIQQAAARPMSAPQGPGAAGRSAAGGQSLPPRRGAEIAAHDPAALPVNSRLPDTHQGSCFDDHSLIPCPTRGAAYYGQDAQYEGAQPQYRDNRDGTISDLVTGLSWEKAHHDTRLDYYAAEAACQQLRLGGFGDWRLPSIKELFSLADFRGSQGRHPFIDTVFDFREPGPEVLQGDRFADTHTTGMMGQTWSATRYTGTHYGRPGVEAAFFFNFLDGHIKQAPTRGRNKLFYRCVRGSSWGDNRFVDLGQGMVEDRASGLVWQQSDDGQARDWPQALAYCQSLTLGGKSGWRLPNVKELQSIVDYSRHAPALDTRFLIQRDPKAWFWSSTTHGDAIRFAAYVCFGPCTSIDGVDVHGAGAQRSDPKVGDPSQYGALGGQRDEVRIRNYVRCVR